MKQFPVLILHGWNLSSAYYQKLNILLKKNGFQVLSFDLPGFGKTKTPFVPLTLSDYVEFVFKKIKSAKLNKVIIIGHSFGGRIGIKLAAEYSQVIHKLILSGTPGINPVPWWKVILFRYVAKSGKLIFSLPIISLLKKQSRKLFHRIAGAYDYSRASGIMRTTFQNIINEDLIKPMRKIKTPALLLWGSNDKIVPVKVAKQMSLFINNSKLILIPSSGHDVMITKAVDFSGQIIEFLKK